MSQVSVVCAEGDSTAAQAMRESLDGICEAIRNRAYVLYESRGYESGSDLNDWLQAERDLYLVPQAEMVETERDIRIQVAPTGLDSKSLEVLATSNMILVRETSSSGSHGGSSGKMLLRRFDLSSGIDSNGVKAKLDSGVLSITAMKSTSTSDMTGGGSETMTSAAGA